MGEQDIRATNDAESLRKFEHSLINDIRALEYMLANGYFETDICRIGAEQEMFIIDREHRPAPISLEILDKLQDADFTTELAKFNLEFNLPPLPFEGNCLRQLEKQIAEKLKKVRRAAREFGAEILLIGIPPTIRKSDLCLGNMTPRPRYAALNDALNRLRGDDYLLYLRGTDELLVKHDSVMLEACNTSFQVHLQVAPGDFARYYNIAQAIAGPVLAAAVNSPLLFGQRLWRETRIAVFQQSIDTRQARKHLRESPPRVRFGEGWVREGVLEIFKDDVTRFRALFGIPSDEKPLELLAHNQIPKLKSLQLHNGTVYRWNRPCYGVTEGKPHLRIENRVLPAGPTPADEIANAAFWLGLMKGLAADKREVTKLIDFNHAKSNFIAASRRGIDTQFKWFGGSAYPAQKLILTKLLPIARAGLAENGISGGDIDRYLGIIEERVRSARVGAEWQLMTYEKIRMNTLPNAALTALSATILRNQKTGRPLHTWPDTYLKAPFTWKQNFRFVEQYMTTDIVTVRADDTLELVASLMAWRKIRHVPVEDDHDHLVGMVNFSAILRFIRDHGGKHRADDIAISEFMIRDVPTVAPSTHTLEALKVMQQQGLSCLPVVEDGQLIGLVTETDILKIAARLLEEKLK